MIHNHLTRDIKPRGECPACDEYLNHVATNQGEQGMTLNLNTQTFELEATSDTGIKVPLKLSIEYPDGFGMYAAKALSHIAESHEVQAAFLSALARDGDASLLDSMAKAGMTLEEPEG